MRSFIAGALVLASFSSFAQQGQGRIEVEASAHTTQVATEYLGSEKPRTRTTSFLPITFNVTQLVGPWTGLQGGVDKLSITALRQVLELMKRDRVWIGAKYELLDFSTEKVYIKEGPDRLIALKFVDLEAISVFKIKDDFFITLRASAGVGSSTDDIGSITEADKNWYQTQISNETQCPSCMGVYWREELVADYLDFGASAEISFKRFSLKFSHRESRDYSEERAQFFSDGAILNPEANIYYDPKYDNQYSLKKHVRYSQSSIRLDYKALKLKNIGDLSVFVGYTFHQLTPVYNVKKNEAIFMHNWVDRKWVKEPVEVPGQGPKSYGTYEAGVKIDLNDLWRKKSK